MKVCVWLGVFIIGTNLCAMENDNDGAITSNTLMQKAPPLSEDLDQAVSNWLWEQREMIEMLVSPPKDYKIETRRAKKEAIWEMLKEKSSEFVRLPDELEEQDSNTQSSAGNHTIRPKYDDRFIIQASNFNRLLAHLVYITGQGDVTKEYIEPAKIDPNKLGQAPDTYMHAGRLATYLLCKQNAHDQGKIRLPETYIKKLPWLNTDNSCPSDHTSVIVQEYVPNFRSLMRLSKDEQVTVINEKLVDKGLLGELYNLITAGAWDACGNIGIAPDNNFYLCDFEPTIFNHPEDFMFQGERGHRQYLSDIYDGIVRAYMLLNKGNGKAAKIWKMIVNDDAVLQEKFKSNNILSSIKLEYEGNASSEHKASLKELYGDNLPEDFDGIEK